MIALFGNWIITTVFFLLAVLFACVASLAAEIGTLKAEVKRAREILDTHEHYE